MKKFMDYILGDILEKRNMLNNNILYNCTVDDFINDKLYGYELLCNEEFINHMLNTHINNSSLFETYCKNISEKKQNNIIK